MSTAEKLEKCRKQRSLSQWEVAEILNVTPQSVSKWETGRAIPSSKNLNRLAELYGVPVSRPFGREC